MRILVSAFEPFGGDDTNPAELVVSRLPAEIAGHAVETVLLPVAYDRAFPCLRAAHRDGVDAILCLGLAGGRAGLTFERVAINLDDCSIPDNDGILRADTPIEPGAPAAVFSTLPVKRMAQAAKAAGIPASVSLSAGAFLCNHILYQALRFAEPRGIMAGFAHLPYLPEQGKTAPSMSLEDDLAGICAAIACL